jgi:hypothetical protein
VPDRNDSSPPHEGEGGRAERLVPELIKRLIEGIDKFSEGKDMRQRVSELRLPKEVLALLLSQLEESKNGLYRALAKELRDFLEQTNFTDELIAALTKLTFEIRTEVRFVPSTDSQDRLTPEVRARVNMKREGSNRPGKNHPSDAPQAERSHSEQSKSSIPPSSPPTSTPTTPPEED